MKKASGDGTGRRVMLLRAARQRGDTRAGVVHDTSSAGNQTVVHNANANAASIHKINRDPCRERRLRRTRSGKNLVLGMAINRAQCIQALATATERARREAAGSIR